MSSGAISVGSEYACDENHRAYSPIGPRKAMMPEARNDGRQQVRDRIGAKGCGSGSRPRVAAAPRSRRFHVLQATALERAHDVRAGPTKVSAMTTRAARRRPLMPSGRQVLPSQPFAAKRFESVNPATAVGSANGKSTSGVHEALHRKMIAHHSTQARMDRTPR